MDPWLIYLTLFAVDTISSTLEVIGVWGSFLTLPLLIFLGQPAVFANGTNLVGIMLQSVGAVKSMGSGCFSECAAVR